MDIKRNGKVRENDICRKSLTVEGVSSDKTEIERGWCKMVSILKDLKGSEFIEKLWWNYSLKVAF